MAVFHESRSAYSTPDRKLISLSTQIRHSPYSYTGISIRGPKTRARLKPRIGGLLRFGGRSIDSLSYSGTDTKMSGEPAQRAESRPRAHLVSAFRSTAPAGQIFSQKDGRTLTHSVPETTLTCAFTHTWSLVHSPRRGPPPTPKQRSRLTTRLTQRQSIRPYPRPCAQLAPHAKMDSHCDCRSLRSSGGRPSRLFWRHELTHCLPTGITLASSRASGRRARTPRAPP